MTAVLSRPSLQHSTTNHNRVACVTCGQDWTGQLACHCGGCHRTFTGITAFDRHQLAGRCCDPTQRGLVPVTKLYWSGWGMPGDDPRFLHEASDSEETSR